MFSPLKNRGGIENGWMDHLMQVFALFMFCGFLLSWLIPETNGKTLEELSGETFRDERQRDAKQSQPKNNEEESKKELHMSEDMA